MWEADEIMWITINFKHNLVWKSKMKTQKIGKRLETTEIWLLMDISI